MVLSDVEEAALLHRARDAGVACAFIAPGKFRTKLDEEAEASYIKALNDAEVDLVVLAGFMRILKGEFLRAFEGRVVNVHPSLLPTTKANRRSSHSKARIPTRSDHHQVGGIAP